jgi:hypothetical protein
MDEICIRQRFNASTSKRPGIRYVCLLPPHPLVNCWSRFDKFTTKIFVTNISPKTRARRKERLRVLKIMLEETQEQTTSDKKRQDSTIYKAIQAETTRQQNAIQEKRTKDKTRLQKQDNTTLDKTTLDNTRQTTQRTTTNYNLEKTWQRIRCHRERTQHYGSGSPRRGGLTVS